MVADNWTFQLEIIKVSIDLLGWLLLIPIGIGIIKVGWKKGLIVFFGIFIAMIVLINNVESL